MNESVLIPRSALSFRTEFVLPSFNTHASESEVLQEFEPLEPTIKLLSQNELNIITEESRNEFLTFEDSLKIEDETDISLLIMEEFICSHKGQIAEKVESKGLAVCRNSKSVASSIASPMSKLALSISDPKHSIQNIQTNKQFIPALKDPVDHVRKVEANISFETLASGTSYQYKDAQLLRYLLHPKSCLDILRARSALIKGKQLYRAAVQVIFNTKLPPLLVNDLQIILLVNDINNFIENVKPHDGGHYSDSGKSITWIRDSMLTSASKLELSADIQMREGSSISVSGLPINLKCYADSSLSNATFEFSLLADIRQAKSSGRKGRVSYKSKFEYKFV